LNGYPVDEFTSGVISLDPALEKESRELALVKADER
jgi:hypothetical protein